MKNEYTGMIWEDTREETIITIYCTKKLFSMKKYQIMDCSISNKKNPQSYIEVQPKNQKSKAAKSVVEKSYLY